MKFFEAFENCMKFAVTAMADKFAVGERPWTTRMKCTMENYQNLEKFIDDIVVQKMKGFEKDTDPNSVMEFLLASEVYRDDIVKISNDLIVAILAGTDTSRNNTITTLCHLAKKSDDRERVREEIK